MRIGVMKLAVYIATVFFMSGCVHQELVLPSLPGGNVQQQSSVDVSDLNVTPVGESIVSRIPFPVDEYRRLRQVGEATVKGTIYIEDSTGRRIYGKQTRLYLNPVTSYSRQWYEESYLGGRKMGKADPRLFNYLKFTTSDAGGNFAFYGVPAGRYYLIGVVRCGQECGYDTPRNIRVAKEIEVGKKDTLDIELYKSIE